MLKYICISDLHAGALTSLLTDRSRPFAKFDPNKISPITRAFASALGPFVEQARKGGHDAPQLILLGDTLELQFATRAEATSNALGFLKALSPHVSPNVIATAGNHDHALWTDARLALHATAFEANPKDTEYREATPAFKEDLGAESRLLNALLRKSGFGKCDLRYPNIGFSNEKRAVLLHHGHFSEDPYWLMTHMISWLNNNPNRPLSVETLAAENAGWLDFAWSAVGDAAGLGRISEHIYQSILTTTGFRHLSKDWAAKIADALGEILPMSGNLTARELIHAITRTGLDMTLGEFRDSERYAQVDKLSTSGLEQLQAYLDGPCHAQLHDELNGNVPDDLTFVLGHTHKPYAQRLRAKNYANAVKVYNTGGWTLNGPRLDNAEGAAMVLIDDQLNTASVRLFSTPKNGISNPAHVEMMRDGPEADAFGKDINRWLRNSNKKDKVWDTLAEVAKGAYERRQKYLLALTTADLQNHISAEAAE